MACCGANSASFFSTAASFSLNVASNVTYPSFLSFSQNANPEKGKFTDPAGAKVVTYDLDETDGDAHPIPKVEAKEGYEFTGWHVSGANEADWLPESETFYVSGLAF